MVGGAARPGRARVLRATAALAVTAFLTLSGHAAPVAAQEDPPTTPPTTAPTTVATTVPTTAPPTTPAPTTAPTTAAPTTPAPETTSAPPPTAAPGGGGGKAPVTTAKPKVTTTRPTSTEKADTTDTTAPPETAPPPTEAPTTVPSTEARSTPTTTGTTAPSTSAPADVASNPTEAVSGAGKALSFLIIAALGLLATVIFLGSRRRVVPVDPALAPIPPLGSPVPDRPRYASTRMGAGDGASSGGTTVKGPGTSATFVPFTRITSASGLVSGEVPVSGVAGARAAHAAGALHERYAVVDDDAAAAPITAELDIVDARTPEVTSRFGTDGASGREAARGVAGDGGPRRAVPQEQEVRATSEAAAGATAEPPAVEPTAASAGPPDEATAGPPDEAAAGPSTGPPAGKADGAPSVIDLVSEVRRSGRTRS